MTQHDADLVGEALLILADLCPEKARLLVLHYVQGQTEEQIAQAWQIDSRTVRREIKGYVPWRYRLTVRWWRRAGRQGRDDDEPWWRRAVWRWRDDDESWWPREYVPGALDYIATIWYVLVEAQRVNLYFEALSVLNDAWQWHRAAWGEAFPRTMLQFLGEAAQASGLARVLQLLAQVRKQSPPQYRRVVFHLREAYDRQQPFAALMLDLLWEADATACLEKCLNLLTRTRNSCPRAYRQLWAGLLALHARQRLGQFVSGMRECPDGANLLLHCFQLLRKLLDEETDSDATHDHT